jgi:hypothetical protein
MANGHWNRASKGGRGVREKVVLKRIQQNNTDFERLRCIILLVDIKNGWSIMGSNKKYLRR